MDCSPRRPGSRRQACSDSGAKTATSGKACLHGKCVCGLVPCSSAARTGVWDVFLSSGLLPLRRLGRQGQGARLPGLIFLPVRLATGKGDEAVPPPPWAAMWLSEGGLIWSQGLGSQK